MSKLEREAERRTTEDPPQLPSMSLMVPIDPETLNRMMQAASPRFKEPIRLIIPNFRLTFLVPAGGTVHVPFPLPSGFYCTRRSPLRFESNYYHKDLVIDVLCDGEKVNPYPLPLTAPFEVDFGVHYVKFERVDIIIVNNTTTDAEVTFGVIPHLIHNELYTKWYSHIIDKAYDMLTLLAEGKIVPLR